MACSVRNRSSKPFDHDSLKWAGSIRRSCSPSEPSSTWVGVQGQRCQSVRRMRPGAPVQKTPVSDGLCGQDGKVAESSGCDELSYGVVGVFPNQGCQAVAQTL